MTKTLTIKVAPFALDTDPGNAQRLVDAIEDGFMSAGIGKICLDFAGIETLTPHFRTHALRVTVALHGQQFLKAALTTVNVSEQLKPVTDEIFGAQS